MARRSEPQFPPVSPGPPGRRGPGRSYDPFYQFEQAARAHGKVPHQAPPPKAELRLVAVLTSKALLVVMASVLALVVLAMVVLMTVRL